MPVILPVLGKSPSFGENCFIAPNATIVGDVSTGKECSFWFSICSRLFLGKIGSCKSVHNLHNLGYPIEKKYRDTLLILIGT